MSSNEITIGIILICLVMSAFFSASETAFSTANRIRLKNVADKGDSKAKLVLHLIDNFDSLISSILIGNNIVNILSASLSTVLFVGWFGDAKGPGISTMVTTIVVLIFGEVTPKSIAKEYPESFAKFSAGFLNGLMTILTPFNWLFSQWKKWISSLFKSENKDSITEEELLTFVEETANDGAIDEEESDMIRNVIKFSDLDAIDIFTPMIDVVAVSEDWDREKIRTVFLESGYSRLPVYKGNINNIIGTIYQKDFFSKVVFENEPLEKVLKPAKFVLGSKKIRELLNELKEDQTHIAIVTSEYGNCQGIITLEDILEELVGEIWDEEDEITAEFVRISQDCYEALGKASIHSIADEFELDMKDINATTVNGWILSLLGRIPVSGDKFEHNDFRFEILSMNKNRIDRVRIEKIEKAESE